MGFKFENSGEEGCKLIFFGLLGIAILVLVLLFCLASGEAGDLMGYVWFIFIIGVVISIIYHGIKGD